MVDRSPEVVGLTPVQRDAMRAVEQEAVLDLVTQMVDRLNRIGDRLEVYAGIKKTERPEERT
jgi:hypothetical protein